MYILGKARMQFNYDLYMSPACMHADLLFVPHSFFPLIYASEHLPARPHAVLCLVLYHRRP